MSQLFRLKAFIWIMSLHFIGAGVAAVGIGGNLVDRKAIAASDFTKITRTAREYVSIIQNARADKYVVAEKR